MGTPIWALGAARPKPLRIIALGTALILVLAATLAPGGGALLAAPAVPAFDHIVVIVMENHAEAEIIGNLSQAPYINQLASQYGLAANYSGIAHPSLPNYLALTGGSTFGITQDCTTCFVNAPNLVADRVAPSGRTWKAYMESMPSACALGDSGEYAQRHDPFVYYNDIRLTAQCSNVVPFSALSADLASASTMPNYVWITPNLCDDMHNCAVSAGDTWLANTVPTILASPAFVGQNSLLLITWDEDDGSGTNQVPALVIARPVPAGFRSTVAYNHYSLLRTIEDAWGLAPLGSNDAGASGMADFFASTPTPQPFVPLAVPQRIADTRQSGGPLSPGSPRCFAVAGQAGIPSDASTAILNVTVTGYSAFGWLSLYPAGQAVPSTSTLDFDTHEVAVANGSMIGIGSGGQVCAVAGGSSTQVMLDATGYVPASSAGQVVMLPSPQRLVDSRQTGGPIAAGASRCVPVAGQDGIPSTATAALLNVTAVNPSGGGWLTLYPNGQTPPATSAPTFDATSIAIANGAVGKVGTGGQVCVAAGNSRANFILDASGYLPSGGLSQLALLPTPQRLVDTRTSGGPLAAGSSRCFVGVGQGGIAPNATVALLNVTAVGYPASGWLTLFGGGEPVPATSTLNFDPQQGAVTNDAVVAVGSNGQVCVSARASSANVVLDATGYEAPTGPSAAARLKPTSSISLPQAMMTAVSGAVRQRVHPRSSYSGRGGRKSWSKSSACSARTWRGPDATTRGAGG